MASIVSTLVLKGGQFISEVDRAERRVQRLQGKLRDFGAKTAGMGAAMAAPIILFGKSVLNASIEFESAFAGIRKTVDATETQFKQLEENVISLSKTIPVSAVELSKIGEIAGQLGVDGVENITKFTDTIARIAVSSNLTTDQAASDFARLANIMGLPLDQIDRVGSAVVGLGNNFATTESEISAFALRLAGAGKTVGLSTDEVLGIGAALSSLGINAEAGGTAFSKVMIKIAGAAANGGEAAEGLASVMGLTVEQFQRVVQENPAQALTRFVESLGAVQDSGGNLLGVLEDLGIKEIRLRDALLRTANAGDLFGRSMALSSEEFIKNTALTIESEKRFETLESQLALVNNKLTDAAITLGKVIAPAMASIVKFIGPVIDGFTDWATESPRLVEALAAVAAAVAVGGTLAVGLGGLAFILGSLSVAGGPIFASIAAVAALAGAFTLLRDDIASFNERGGNAFIEFAQDVGRVSLDIIVGSLIEVGSWFEKIIAIGSHFFSGNVFSGTSGLEERLEAITKKAKETKDEFAFMRGDGDFKGAPDQTEADKRGDFNSQTRFENLLGGFPQTVGKPFELKAFPGTAPTIAPKRKTELPPIAPRAIPETTTKSKKGKSAVDEAKEAALQRTQDFRVHQKNMAEAQVKLDEEKAARAFKSTEDMRVHQKNMAEAQAKLDEERAAAALKYTEDMRVHQKNMAEAQAKLDEKRAEAALKTTEDMRVHEKNMAEAQAKLDEEKAAKALKLTEDFRVHEKNMAEAQAKLDEEKAAKALKLTEDFRVHEKNMAEAQKKIDDDRATAAEKYTQAMRVHYKNMAAAQQKIDEDAKKRREEQIIFGVKDRAGDTPFEREAQRHLAIEKKEKERAQRDQDRLDAKTAKEHAKALKLKSKQLKESANDIMFMGVTVQDDLRGSFRDLFTDLDSGKGVFDSLGSAFDSFADNINRKLLNMSADKTFNMLFGGGATMAGGGGGVFDIFTGGGFGGGGGGGGGLFSGIGDLFSFANGGVMTSKGPVKLRRFAAGGIAKDPTLAMFGEGRGSEAFVPLPDGRSIPVNMKGSQRGGNNITVNITTQDAKSFFQNKGQVAAVLNRAIARGERQL